MTACIKHFPISFTDTRAIVVNLVQDMNHRHPDAVNQMVNSMPPDMKQKLHNCITSAN